LTIVERLEILVVRVEEAVRPGTTEGSACNPPAAQVLQPLTGAGIRRDLESGR